MKKKKLKKNYIFIPGEWLHFHVGPDNINAMSLTQTPHMRYDCPSKEGVILGTIRPYQTCRVCGNPYPYSDGALPIECFQTYPTKYFIRISGESLYRNHKGNALQNWVTSQRALHEMLGGEVAEMYGCSKPVLNKKREVG